MPELPVIQPGRPAGPPPFARIAIVGVGLIGGSIALAARARWPAALIIGIDRNDVLERAMLRHAVDVGADDLGMAAEADLVVLAAPVRTNLALVGRLAEVVAGKAVITDTGSTKRAIVAAARALPPRLAFVGGHPLAGAARSGIEHARPDLFAGRPWFFTPERTADPAALERL
ncbi:MAG TPA: prephenate dehydrogenase/arogenate dehydrogenase family protein, partial [Vicinamibacterales bacterium]|nr:prephenate dehydrogenase/arogenate dehydrogenase family protein [Vicinamibacterales bacterium]